MDTETPTVEVKFITKLDDALKVTEKPFRLSLEFGRLGLSGVINHLLALDPPKPFDFLIDNEFLRTTLGEYLKASNSSSEETIVIEYVEAIQAPKFKGDFKHDDWISCIHAQDTHCYLTGSYDNIVRIHDLSGESILECKGHSKPVKAIARFKAQDETDSIRFVTGSQDQTLRIWKSNVTQKNFSTEYICNGHKGSVECVDFSKLNQSKICSGGWDSTILIWDTNVESEAEEKPKKRKVASEAKKLEPIAALLAHTQCVSALTWTQTDQLISASWDHSIKFWDVEKQEATSSWTGNVSIFSMSIVSHVNLLATGNSDYAVRLWDMRTSGETVAQKLLSHTNWVTSVKWHPTSPYLLLSGSADKTVKLWDVRSKVPLHTVTDHTDKVFAVDWDLQDNIISGGADSTLRINQMEQKSK